MTQYASFDSTIGEPAPITGWWDTAFSPLWAGLTPANLMELSPAQWAQGQSNTSGWAKSGNSLVPYVQPPPTPTPQQRAASLLAAAIAIGIEITSTSNAALNGLYALDAVSTAQIFQVGTYAATFGTFPSGGMTMWYPDAQSVPHNFTVVQFIGFLKAVAPLISQLQTAAGVVAQGGDWVVLSQTATIV